MRPISGKELAKVAERLGFVCVRQRGSHARYAHADGRKTVVPLHGNEELGTGLLLAILRQLGVTKEELERLR